MAERIVNIGVPVDAFLEMESLRGEGDKLAEAMLQEETVELVEDLTLDGFLDRWDEIDVTYFPDPGIPWDSFTRVVRITKIVRDEQNENIVSQTTKELLARRNFKTDN